MADARAARDWLCAPASQVSAHYLIDGSGKVWHLVAEDKRAWHAGAGAWGKCTDVNSRSVGIELANAGSHPFAEAQMHALEALLPAIMARWDVPPCRVIAHSDLAPGRKIDPGPRFDWLRLARQGCAISLGPAGRETPDPAAAQALLRRAGYTADVPFEVALSAFRLRHHPGACGALDAVDMAAIRALAARYPVDLPPAVS